MKKYFVFVNEERKGPFSVEELGKKYLTEDILVWCEGMDDWQKAGEVAELKDIIHQLPPTPPHLKIIKNWLTESIAATAFGAIISYIPGFWLCAVSLPFGGIAIWKALKVQELHHKQEEELARHYANEARKWMIWEMYALGVGILFSLVALAIIALLTFSLWEGNLGVNDVLGTRF